MWDIKRMEPNPNNPNEMTDAQFNMLYDNIDKMGITDPILCVPLPGCDPQTGDGVLRIIGGEHRWEVAKLFDFQEVPVTVVVDTDFDEDKQKFQIVRHNIIHGQMSPQKFMKMYESMGQKYSDEVMAESFGFLDQDEFTKLLRTTAASLPEGMSKDFLEATKEVKTIDELSKVLNRLFAGYGDTLPFGYMIFDYGGKDSIWLRMPDKSTLKFFEQIGKLCIADSVTLDAFMGSVVQMIAKGEIDAKPILAGLDKVELPDKPGLPTLDSMEFA